MSNWNMVWLQPKTSAPGSGMNTPRASTAETPLSVAEERKIEELRRPTASSQAKSERPWMKRFYVADYSEQGRNSWSKMELFLDSHKCMYKENGTVKNGKKI